jgi:hypothetical protein
MKKVIILALLPVFLYSIIGWQWMFALMLSSHQEKEWTAFFHEEELEIISVNTNDLGIHDSFLVNDHELFHHGKYFDIKFKKTRGNEIIFYCHPDEEESALYSSLDTHLKDEAALSNPANQKLLKIVKLSVFDNGPDSILLIQEKFPEAEIPYDIPLPFFLVCNPVFVPPDAGALIS